MSISIDNNIPFANKQLFIFGNGFDRCLGFKTKYSDFVDSDEWKEMYQKRIKEVSKPMLLQYLYGKKFIDEWFDLESALLDYVSQRNDGSFVNNLPSDREDYELVCQALVSYISNLFKRNQPAIWEKPAGKLISKLTDLCNIHKIYTFNYTPVDWIASIAGQDGLIPRVVYFSALHGTIKEDHIKQNVNVDKIILGIETDDISKIAPGYSFLIKSNNPNYRRTDIVYDLINTQEVVIFGHSLNSMDFPYFEDYLKMLTDNMDRERKLTLITYDEESRIALLDNIRKNGISVLKILAHTEVEFILTSNIEKDINCDDSKKLEALIDRIPSEYENK